ncbi:hypothetical protein BKE30_03740 [Alkanindiges hydrocarboniclasticus]|uniref:AB hydrolase-1 domain-containing protein n=1 Tax=Alkanindiges hydrocarboniclasticus TaxID=1907941 RepID=A0A1S8CW50_9GAMM|nr:alpha/beta hydrolase [Alkanindiges hydrocarboniclasticus]ONG41557.1 hypothetical protein BKE30_03740 [Alkanindiges hydrocarboniclasticus]
MKLLSQRLGKLIWVIYFFFGAKASGLKKQSIDINNHQYNYLISKKFNPALDTLVLLHGFTGFKEYWFGFMMPLKHKFNIISIDLPGHGSSSFNIKKSFLDQSIELIDAIKTRHQLSQFHFVAASIGAWIACHYMAKFPEQLKSLVFIGPAGIAVTQTSEFYQAVDQQKNPFWINTQQDYNQLLGFAVFKLPPDFWPLSPFLLADYLNHQPVYQIIWNQIVDAHQRIQALNLLELSAFKGKKIVVWGKEERTFHSQTLEVLKQHVKDIQVFICPQSGHSVQVDQPKWLASLVLQQLSQHPNN